MTNKILIVGAGITGISIAENLRRAGQNVTLVDRILPGEPEQTSYGNAGLLARAGVGPVADPSILREIPRILLDPNSPIKLRWSYVLRFMPWATSMLRNGMQDRARQIVPAMNELIYDTVEQHQNLAKGTKAAEYIKLDGLTSLYRKKSDFMADRFLNKAKKSVGVEWVEHDRAALLARDPKLGAAYTFGVEYKGQGWLTDPSAYVTALAQHFADNGGTILTHEIADIGTDRVTCSDGTEIFADTIVLATGAWSKSLTKTFGHKVPLQGERGYHILLKNPSCVPPHPYLVKDIRCGFTPMLKGLRCAGTTEFAKLDSAPSKSPIPYLQKSVHHVYPDMAWESMDTWMGNRPTTVDSLPMLGRTKSAPNIIYAFGGQHLGMTMGPKVGKIIRDIVLDKSTNTNLSPYAVNRFD